MNRQMTLLPDCLPLVIDQTNDRGTLFSLLTVSRWTFFYAAKRLYAQVYCPRFVPTAAMKRLVRLLLSISPTQDESVQELRDSLGVEWPRPQPPLLDYLAFITDIFDKPFWSTQLRSEEPTIIWAIIGHRLHQVQTLILYPKTLRRIKDKVTDLVCLRKVKLTAVCANHLADIHTFVERYAREHHQAGRRIMFDFEMPRFFSRPQFLQTLALLDPALDPPPRAITNNNALICAAFKDTMDFSRVESAAISSMHCQSHLASVLGRCRQLKAISLSTGDRDGSYLDCWSSPLLPPPPVQSLDLQGGIPAVYECANVAIPALASTLRDIKITTTISSWSADPNPYMTLLVHRIPFSGQFPHLRTLNLSGACYISFPTSSFPSMPSLESFEIHIAGEGSLTQGSPRQTSYVLPTQVQHIPVSELVQLAPLHTWPVLDLPRCEFLSLDGRAAAEFHPKSLVNMPALKTLSVILQPKWEPFCLTNCEWTWDWHLLSLTTLKLEGLMAIRFDWRALCNLPQLLTLVLGCIDTGTTLSVPDVCTTVKNDDTASFSSSPWNAHRASNAVVELNLIGPWKVSDDACEHLVFGWLPNLVTITLHGMAIGDMRVFTSRVSRLRKLFLLDANHALGFQRTPHGDTTSSEYECLVQSNWTTTNLWPMTTEERAQYALVKFPSKPFHYRVSKQI